MDRVILFHFHLFKNAGTSVDEILKRNFGDKWVTKEFPFDLYRENISEVIEWIRDEEDKIAFSSHTARLFKFWELEKEGIKIIPIIFVRHPIVRIHSAYKFEREVQKDIESLETVIARNTSLKGYVEIRWFLPNDHQTRNFHVARFSDLFFEEDGSFLDKALKSLEILPFVGLVERFEESIKKLEILIKEYYPEFKAEVVYENVHIGINISLEDRLKMIEKEVGESFYKKMVEVNRDDIIFWEKVKNKYEI
ncbi:MAG: sulfotransferase family 2 domain-containing protein [Caldimicrobium sp.]|nr:sulfotransferase family 2 domain-containing protein [Dictyoglomus thermophilum]MCS7200421.1 sulfotransferase family protein [Caldimicrobium sp.]MCX7720000.1 sulfotransferase family protein [Dictyoglomus thermophilum]MDW8094173.1 sulfotransferase family 2 domain-containing protein [Caldimicrobium sp.]